VLNGIFVHYRIITKDRVWGMNSGVLRKEYHVLKKWGGGEVFGSQGVL